MKSKALQRWMARVGLVAALLLLLVPTAGRLAQASASANGAQATHHAAHAAHASQHAGGLGQQARDDRRDAPRVPAHTDTDCDYCLLLASLVAMAHAAVSTHPVATAVAAAAHGTFRLPWLHPNGLGSRGPPLHG